ncbi:uncharacterized protein LOC125497028 isoform X2 [Beta vulgaris subsp. vulgaris]|uniref:uncharacterized protein LOC125497028 isoform X2 n=1 Tax=Beta vulgaris subsp. vulgaris TaxID=3555 RepID=UPI002548A6BC|nr:uncharacterized protein LOC125497028 isoform X2 [Beta vulgaris subsp. vulgaris]
MVFHLWESNFTPRENGFTLFCQPNNVKLKIKENSFPGKRFTPYQTEPLSPKFSYKNPLNLSLENQKQNYKISLFLSTLPSTTTSAALVRRLDALHNRSSAAPPRTPSSFFFHSPTTCSSPELYLQLASYLLHCTLSRRSSSHAAAAFYRSSKATPKLGGFRRRPPVLSLAGVRRSSFPVLFVPAPSEQRYYEDS